ncbi:MAG: DUF4399 domain-containing protein [Cryobacterium sp.]|nr:DUF4399 domain-containing protein [Oligoflexia bacterium]
MKNFSLSILCLSISAVAGTAVAGQSADPQMAHLNIPGFEAAPATAKVIFESPKNHDVVTKKFKVKFGVSGMKLHPAGELNPGTGHHHLIIDGDSVPAGQTVPADATHIHFGKGQTETEIELAPGPHKLTLQFANGAHLSYGPTMATTIDIIVK